MAEQTTKLETGKDALGYDVYALTLWDRITNALNKPKLGDDPLVVGVFGEWGAGKSKLLELMHDLALAKNKEDCDKRSWASADEPVTLTVPVWFHPWKYEHEAHMGVPLLMHIQAALSETLDKATTPLEALFKDLDESKSWFMRNIKTTHVQAKQLTKILDNEFFQISMGVAAGALFTPAAGVATATGLKWLAEMGKKTAETTAFAGSYVPKKLKKTSEIPLVTQDGSYYYKTHQMLRKLTRISPISKEKKAKGETSDIKGLDAIRRPLNLNFVIFIDDLDRCLPEKSVQVLELIKTLLNVDSFAFVLALDDEVIERGIGHRYRDYTLKDKKPHMPITGFEYLEKIVHLPFPLPQLTDKQAQAFIIRKEDELAHVNSLERWFTVRNIERGMLEQKTADAQSDDKTDDKTAKKPENSVLMELFISSFDAYVPRKMVRVVELMHQIAAIAKERGRPLTLSTATGDSAVALKDNYIDIRVVFTLLLIQLFQPELFRLMRRKEAAFPAFLRAFSKQKDGLNSLDVSEVDLWTWATFPDELDPAPAPAVGATAPAKAQPIIRATSVHKAIQQIALLGKDKRHGAQQIRLPIAEKLVEHLQVQRHVFNPIKLMFKLADMLGAAAVDLKPKPYFSLLGAQEKEVFTQTTKDDASAAGKTSAIVYFNREGDIKTIAQNITSPDEALQANLTELSLPEGKVLDQDSCKALAAELKTWLGDTTNNKFTTEPARQVHLLKGLSHFSRWVDWGTGGKELFALVAPEVRSRAADGDQLIQIIQPLARLRGANWVTDSPDLALARQTLLARLKDTGLKPKPRAETGDALGVLGDPRFTGPYDLPKREPIDAPEAPAGFVLCPIPGSGEYVFDDGDEMRPQKRPYYISRFAVTVAQYAAFVAADGYKDQALWEASHKDAWLWRTGEFDSSKTIEDKGYKDWLALRPADLRHQPMDWAEQLANLNRPVTGVTWFEATAYAAWLEVLRQKGDDGYDWGTLKAPQYRLRLPTEGEWERAARAGGTGKFPWGDDDADIDQCANVDGKVGHPTTVGSYPPNALGLYDMAGNVWQWQANLYTNPYENKLILPKTSLKIGKDYQTSDRVSLRGGSWIDHPDIARCSARYRFLPDNWYDVLGFRLVLSLADFES